MATYTAAELRGAYSSALYLLPSSLPSWLDQDDAIRRLTYELYEDIYWNVPGVFKLDMRGTNNRPIYVPSAKTIVEATNRFLGRGFTFAATIGTAQSEKDALTAAFSQLFKREQWRSKFASQKRYGLIRGDAMWHVVGNDTAAQGRRISLYELDPGSVIPIYDEENLERVIGYHIVEYIVGDDGKSFIRRQTYLKQTTGTSTIILSSLGDFEEDKWRDLKAQPLKWLKPQFQLPPQVTSLPIYQWRNQRIPNWPFGASEIRGVERLMGAVNQAISDEELALALDGIGVYATTSGPPKDDQGDDLDWVLGPGSVVEHAPGTDFNRVGGVGSLQPFQDHLSYLNTAMREVSGTPDSAIGKVDVSIAESGISLALQMGPMLAKVDERNDDLLDTHDQMFFDLATMWFPAYEKMSFGDALVEPQVGDALPENKQQSIDNIIALHAEGVVDTRWALDQLTKLGYDVSNVNLDAILAEQAAKAVAADPYAKQAADAAGGTGADNPQAAVDDAQALA